MSQEGAFIQCNAAMLKAYGSADGPALALGRWLTIEDTTAPTLSKRFKTFAVSWQIAKASDLVWIQAYRHGREVRMLMYTADDGWCIHGKPLPFERRDAMRRWTRKMVFASPDGHEILEDFLGCETLELEHFDPARTPDSVPTVPVPSKVPGENESVVLSQLPKRRLEALKPHLADKLRWAADKGDARQVQALLRAGVSPNWLDEEGNSALHHYLEEPMVKALVGAGADINLRNRGGETPLISALTNLTPACVAQIRVLLNHGADPSATYRGRGVLSVLRSAIPRQKPLAGVYSARAKKVMPLLKAALKR